MENSALRSSGSEDDLAYSSEDPELQAAITVASPPQFLVYVQWALPYRGTKMHIAEAPAGADALVGAPIPLLCGLEAPDDASIYAPPRLFKPSHVCAVCRRVVLKRGEDARRARWYRWSFYSATVPSAQLKTTGL